MKTYKEYKKALLKENDRIKKIRAEVFSQNVKKLGKHIVELENGEIYLIRQRSTGPYENSKIFKIKKDEVSRYLQEEITVTELAKIMASK